MQVFKSPKDSLGNLGAQSAAALIAAASDIAVVIDGKGVIRDVSFNKNELSLELDSKGRWLGTDILETVTPDSRIKMKSMLQDIVANKSSGWRQINYPRRPGLTFQCNISPWISAVKIVSSSSAAICANWL